MIKSLFNHLLKANLCLLVCIISMNAIAQVRYVKPVATGTGSGLSWANASADLQLMISNSSSGQQVWVAAGTYKPRRPADNLGILDLNNRNNAFVLKNNVQVYGGFTGSETLLSQRDWVSNSTVLSGDLGIINDSTDNCYHVVISAGEVGSASLDGFSIVRGHANGGVISITVNANSISSGNGAGILIQNSSPDIGNCTFSNNKALHGGGLCNIFSSAARITNCIFSANGAGRNGTGAGGGIYLAGSPEIINCTFAGNYVYGVATGPYATPYITNCIFTGNEFYGFQSNGNAVAPTITNCIFTGNSVSGMFFINFSGSTPVISNCIIWGNSSVTNLSLPSAQVFNNIIEGGYQGGSNNIDTDPLFISTTGSNYRLQPNSPAIDAGNNALLPTGITTDLDGNARIVGARIDLGAYEATCGINVVPAATGIVYVDSSKNGNGSSWASAVPSLSDALKAAKTNAAIQQIWVVKGTYYPYYDAATLNCTKNSRDNSFVMVNNVRVYGGFAGTETLVSQRNWTTNKTILSGDVGVRGNNNDNVYHVVISAGAVGSARLDGFTVTGGNGNLGTDLLINNVNVNRGRGGGMSNVSSAPNIEHCIFLQNRSSRGGGVSNISSSPIILNCDFIENVQDFWGAGMYNEAGSPIIKNCNFLNNGRSIGTGDVYGGGMTNDNASPDLTACVFSGNVADFGGGIDNLNNASPSFYRCTFTENFALARGGGVFLEINSIVTLVDCLISGNFAAGNGGGINSEATAQPIILNCSIGGNRAGGFGGGIMQVNTNAVVRNSIIWGNGAGIDGKSIYPVTGGTGVSYSLVENGYASGNNLLTRNPLFIDPVLPAQAPTSLGNYRLQDCSPALNAGFNAYVTGGNDLDDNVRISNGTVDMGAYEKAISPQATFTWLGVNSNWNDVVNWCGNIVPASTNNVIIPQGVANYPLIDATNGINDIRLENGASISVTSTGQFTIGGAYTNNGATIDNYGKWIMAGNAAGQVFPGANGTVVKMKSLELRNSVGIRLDKSFEINDLKIEAGVNTVNSSVNILVKP